MSCSTSSDRRVFARRALSNSTNAYRLAIEERWRRIIYLDMGVWKTVVWLGSDRESSSVQAAEESLQDLDQRFQDEGRWIRWFTKDICLAP